MTLVGLPMYFVLKGAVQDTDHYEASLVQGAVYLHELNEVEFIDAVVLVFDVVVLFHLLTRNLLQLQSSSDPR